MVNAQSLAARILANIAIWSILGFGIFFLLAFKDYTMGFELAILSLGKSRAKHHLSRVLRNCSFGTCTAGHTCPRFPVDIRVRHHGLSNHPVRTDWRAWHVRREEWHQT